MSRGTIKHDLKCWRHPFNLILSGAKKYELRKDDRTPRFEIGDFLILKEWEEGVDVYTGREITVQVTYVMRPNADFPGIKRGWCVMSIEFAQLMTGVSDERYSLADER